jgi:hypothetical protein
VAAPKRTSKRNMRMRRLCNATARFLVQSLPRYVCRVTLSLNEIVICLNQAPRGSIRRDIGHGAARNASGLS